MKLSMVLPFYRSMDAGSGGGQSGANGTGGGFGTMYPSQGDRGADRGAGDQGRGAGGGVDRGGSTPYQLTDDSEIVWDGKPAKWKDIRSAHFVPKSDHDAVVKRGEDARTMLTDYARKLDQGFAELQRQRTAASHQQPRQPQTDIADELAAMPILDGQTAAKVVRALREQGLGPIAQIVGQMQATIKAQQDDLKAIRTGMTSLTEREQTQQFDSKLSGLLKGVKEVKGLARLPIDNPIVKEIAADLYLSYDPKSWNDGDFHKMLTERLEGLVQLVLEDQKYAVEQAKQKRRTFFDVNRGAARPGSGASAPRFMRGHDIARESGLWDKAANQ